MPSSPLRLHGRGLGWGCSGVSTNKDTNPPDQGLTLMTSFNLHCFLRDSISNKAILRTSTEEFSRDINLQSITIGHS